MGLIPHSGFGPGGAGIFGGRFLRRCRRASDAPPKPPGPCGEKTILDFHRISLHLISCCQSLASPHVCWIAPSARFWWALAPATRLLVDLHPMSNRTRRTIMTWGILSLATPLLFPHSPLWGPPCVLRGCRPGHIVSRLGLAPGASAHPSVSLPMTRWLAYAGDGDTPCSCQDLVQCLGLTTNHTGADVRLTTGTVLGKRSAHASVRALWRQWQHLFSVHWNSKSHINFLEMKMILLTLLWKARSPKAVGKRWLHLEDSMVCLYILTKGRTSSHMLQPLCSQIGAVQLALSGTLLHAHVSSSENPTDAASRS